jgi:hypothetical protein
VRFLVSEVPLYGGNLKNLTDLNVELFRKGLALKAHRLLYHSTLGLRVMKKKKNGSKGCSPDVSLNSRLGSNKEEEERM